MDLSWMSLWGCLYYSDPTKVKLMFSRLFRSWCFIVFIHQFYRQHIEVKKVTGEHLFTQPVCKLSRIFAIFCKSPCFIRPAILYFVQIFLFSSSSICKIRVLQVWFWGTGLCKRNNMQHRPIYCNLWRLNHKVLGWVIQREEHPCAAVLAQSLSSEAVLLKGSEMSV